MSKMHLVMLEMSAVTERIECILTSLCIWLALSREVH